MKVTKVLCCRLALSRSSNVLLCAVLALDIRVQITLVLVHCYAAGCLQELQQSKVL